MSGFYKLFEDEDGEYLQGKNKVNVILAPNFVCAPGYTLLIEKHSEYSYPVDGWYYFESEEDMMATFGVTKIEPKSEI